MPATFPVPYTSPNLSISTPELARDEVCFRLWAVAVKLNLDAALNPPLPEELQNSCTKRFVFPTWLGAGNVRNCLFSEPRALISCISQNAHSSPIFEPLKALLRSKRPDSATLEDNDTNRDLHLAMSVIIKNSSHLMELWGDRYEVGYGVADFRRPIDNLINSAWEY